MGLATPHSATCEKSGVVVSYVWKKLEVGRIPFRFDAAAMTLINISCFWGVGMGTSSIETCIPG